MFDLSYLQAENIAMCLWKKESLYFLPHLCRNVQKTEGHIHFQTQNAVLKKDQRTSCPIHTNIVWRLQASYIVKEKTLFRNPMSSDIELSLFLCSPAYPDYRLNKSAVQILICEIDHPLSCPDCLLWDLPVIVETQVRIVILPWKIFAGWSGQTKKIALNIWLTLSETPCNQNTVRKGNDKQESRAQTVICQGLNVLSQLLLISLISKEHQESRLEYD